MSELLLPVGSGAYSFAAVLAAGVALISVLGGRRGGKSYRLPAAALITAGWGMVMAFHAATGRISFFGLYLAELVRDAGWLIFLVRELQGPGRTHLSRGIALAAHLLWSGLIVIGLIAHQRGELLDVLGQPRDVYYLGPLVAALAGLVLVEQYFRNANADLKWAIKYMCLGLGALFVFDIYMYANAMLFRNINVNLWAARAFLAGVTMILVGISVKRNPVWSREMFISRKAVFFSGTLLAVGAYLLIMAAGGWYLKVYGGSIGAVALPLFLSGATLVLLIVLFSGQVRARARVFITKHFYANKYEYRDEWLRLIETLDAPGSRESLNRRAVQAIAQIIGSHGGLLWFVVDGKPQLLEAWSMKPPEPGADMSGLSNFVSETGWIVDTLEYQRNPARYSGLGLPDWLSVRPYQCLVVPLMQGTALAGLLVLKRPPPPFRLTYEDIDLLKTVGRQVASYIAQSLATQKLAENRQFEAYNRMTSFLMHDIKNLIAQQKLVVENAERHRGNPEFIDDAIRTVEGSVKRMNKLLHQLQRGARAEAVVRIDLIRLLAEVCEQTSDRAPQPQLETELKRVIVTGELERLRMAFTHLIRNAQDATGADGSIQVAVNESENNVRVAIADSGEGMDPEFISQRLFRPFDSTKGAQGMGIGVYQAREYVKMLGGALTVDSTPAKGTTITIVLPVDQQAPGDQAEEASYG